MLKVLLVDEDDEVRDTLGQVLREWGHDCVAVARGREGLVQLLRRGGRFDVLLLDQTLTGRVAPELLRGAATALYGPVHLVLMVSRALEPGVGPWATDRCGPVTVLEKPFSASMLRSALEGTPVRDGDDGNAEPSPRPGRGRVGRTEYRDHSRGWMPRLRAAPDAESRMQEGPDSWQTREPPER